MEGRLLLDVIIRKGAAILELLSGEDETLLVWGNTFLVLDLGLDLVLHTRDVVRFWRIWSEKVRE